MASTLLPELVEEILLRVPPDEPAHLFRAALVCKSWCRIISDRIFLRRYRRFHRSPPLIGYIQSDHGVRHALTTRFIPTSTTSPVFTLGLDCSSWALDCRHGRVLIRTSTPNDTMGPLVVWDPITGQQQHLSIPIYPYDFGCMVAVLCAIDGCDHLDCHSGPFLLVFVGTKRTGDDGRLTWVSTYSSETGMWSASSSIDTNSHILRRPSLLIRDALYFILSDGNILKYDLCSHGLSVISLSGVPMSVLIKSEGELGIVTLLHEGIYMLSREAGTDGIGQWVKRRIMGFETMLPKCDYSDERQLIGFAEGTDTIFINTYKGIFTLDLKSRHVKRVRVRVPHFPLLPYMSFYTPRF